MLKCVNIKPTPSIPKWVIPATIYFSPNASDIGGCSCKLYRYAIIHHHLSAGSSHFLLFSLSSMPKCQLKTTHATQAPHAHILLFHQFHNSIMPEPTQWVVPTSQDVLVWFGPLCSLIFSIINHQYHHQQNDYEIWSPKTLPLRCHLYLVSLDKLAGRLNCPDNRW